MLLTLIGALFGLPAGFAIDFEALYERRGRSERSQLDLMWSCDVVAQSMSAPIRHTLHASPDSVGKLRLQGKLVTSAGRNTPCFSALSKVLASHVRDFSVWVGSLMVVAEYVSARRCATTISGRPREATSRARRCAPGRPDARKSGKHRRRDRRCCTALKTEA